MAAASIRSAKKLVACLWVSTLMLCLAAPAFAEETPVNDAQLEVINTLKSFTTLQNDLKKDIKNLGPKIKASASESEKQQLIAQQEKLQEELQRTQVNFENVAAGVDLQALRNEKSPKFNFQQEVFSLLEPALKEMKHMTGRVRQKSDLRERIALFNARLPDTRKAIANLARLKAQTKDKAILGNLNELLDYWQQQESLMLSELQAAELRLEQLKQEEMSLAETSQSYLKNFFQRRGLYLLQAVLVVIGVFLVSRLVYRAIVHFIPGYRAKHRSFRLRLVDLVHRMATILLAIIAPLIVFYVVEDWVLFSLGLLFLIGVAWTLRHTLPTYWKQIELFLNIGAVREGERMMMDGLPWKVSHINVFCVLENPAANLKRRVPIDDLVDHKSRPIKSDDPWFPCVKGDWVILGDGVRGKVIAISEEMVQLVERGGAVKTYPTPDFLGLSPRNLAVDFRIKETIGISYRHQQDATSVIPDKLREHIQQQIEKEGYGPKLLNLRVEFEAAADSSLNLVVIADFKGELGDLYNRLRRAIQRWCVDACTENDWEIPFPQLTVHPADPKATLL